MHFNILYLLAFFERKFLLHSSLSFPCSGTNKSVFVQLLLLLRLRDTCEGWNKKLNSWTRSRVAFFEVLKVRGMTAFSLKIFKSTVKEIESSHLQRSNYFWFSAFMSLLKKRNFVSLLIDFLLAVMMMMKNKIKFLNENEIFHFKILRPRRPPQEEKCSIDFETVARQRQQPHWIGKNYNYNASSDNAEVHRASRDETSSNKHNFSIIIVDSIRLGRMANVQHLQNASPSRAASNKQLVVAHIATLKPDYNLTINL